MKAMLAQRQTWAATEQVALIRKHLDNCTDLGFQ